MATYNENASLTTRRYGCKATTHEAVARRGRVADREVRVERGAVCGRPGDEALEGGLWHQVGGLCSKFGPRGAGQGACAPIDAERWRNLAELRIDSGRILLARLYRRRCDDRGEVRRRLSARNLRASPLERASPRLAPHSGPKSVPLEPNAILARRPQRPTPTAQSRRPHRTSGCWHARARNFESTTRSRSYKENASLTTRRYGRPLAACLTA